MVRPQQRVVIYSGGIKKKSTKNEYAIDYAIKKGTRKSPYVLCNRCDNKVTITPQGSMRKHRMDRNVDLIYCLEKENYRELTDQK